MGQIAEPQLSLFDYVTETGAAQQEYPTLPSEDNTPEGLQALLHANARLRKFAWPQPFDITTHTLHRGDARDLSWIPNESVHLVVTSPPYWTLKQYKRN
jgi:site-specific DNA-methyltransferase (adenine-specific)